MDFDVFRMTRFFFILMIKFESFSYQVLAEDAIPTITRYSDCDIKITSKGVEITQPDYPNMFKQDMDCKQLIQFQDNETVTLTFLEINLAKESQDPNQACHSDRVEVYDGIDENAEKLGSFCGQNPVQISSSGSSLLLWFRSDSTEDPYDEKAPIGYRVIADIVSHPTCFCEKSNGGRSKNSILCGSEKNLIKIDTCGPDEWCTGPQTLDEGIDAADNRNLCQKEKISCGGGYRAPSCSQCIFTNNWCNGECEFDWDDNKCKEIDNCLKQNFAIPRTDTDSCEMMAEPNVQECQNSCQSWAVDDEDGNTKHCVQFTMYTTKDDWGNPQVECCRYLTLSSTYNYTLGAISGPPRCEYQDPEIAINGNCTIPVHPKIKRTDEYTDNGEIPSCRNHDELNYTDCFLNYKDAFIECESNSNCVGIVKQIDESTKKHAPIGFYLCQQNFTISQFHYEEKDRMDKTNQPKQVYKKKKGKVYHYDFVRSNKGFQCLKRNENVLKEFLFPTDDFSDPSKALMGCEMYCSKNNDCWGCSVHCSTSDNCQWNAITECGELLNWTGLIEGDVTQKPICMDIYVSTRYEAHQLKWSFGTCNNPSSYEDYKQYFQRCCLPPGPHILTCTNMEKPEGWKNSFIEISGRRFCDDFMTYTLMEKIDVTADDQSEFIEEDTNTNACPKEYPYAHDKSHYRNKCSDAAAWNFIDPQIPPEIPEIDENGNELPFQDRAQNFPAQVVSCPHFPTPCTDAAVAQCRTVDGSLAGFADDFGRSYSSIFDAMKRCKEVKDCKGISRTIISGKKEKLKFGEDHEIEYHLPTVPVWTLRSSESIIECKTCTNDPKTYEYSMFRRCFDGEACMESWKYVTGTVLMDVDAVLTYQECLKACNLDEDCKVWDYHKGKCRLLSDEGNGPKSGYDGAVSGKKNCMKIWSKPGQKSIECGTDPSVKYLSCGECGDDNKDNCTGDCEWFEGRSGDVSGCKDKSPLCSNHGISTGGITITKCPSTLEFCEVFFNQGKINGIQVNSCSDYCAAHGLKCLHSYQLREDSKCSESPFMMSPQPGADIYELENKYYQKYQKNQYYLKYTTCDVPKDVANGIGCVCGRLDQCCSKLKVRGIGPGKEYFEPAMQQYQYSGTTLGKPRYTMQEGGKTCDIVNTREEYRKRYVDINQTFPYDSLSHRYSNDQSHNFWKVEHDDTNNYDMNENPIELTIGMREGKPYDKDEIQDFNKRPNNEYREDKCGIDLLEPYCASTCPHDCISGQWESVHPKRGSEPKRDGFGKIYYDYDVIMSNNNFITMECDLNPYEECPENTTGCYGFGCPNTCFCEEHCSWEKCRLEEPPKDCVEKLGGKWVKNSFENYWTAEFTGVAFSSNVSLQNPANTIKDEVSRSEYSRPPNAKKYLWPDANEKDKSVLNSVALSSIDGNLYLGCFILLFAFFIFYFLHSPREIKDNPKVLLTRFKHGFQVVSFILAIGMTIILVERFMENADSTSIQYKVFNEGPDDKYPTFSICFEGQSFLWYNDHQIFNEYGLSTTSYHAMMTGEHALTYEYIPRTGLYKKVQVEMRNDSISFDHFHVQVSDFLEVADFKTNDENTTYYYQEGIYHKAKPPFDIGYQTTTMVCFTRQSDDVSNLFRLSDSISLKKMILTKTNYINTKVKFIFHYPGQLLRSLDKPSLSTTFSKYHWDEILSFNLAQTTILRKRPESNKPCDSEIENQDENFLLGVSNTIGCIPPYWQSILQGSQKMDKCSTQKQLKDAYNYSQNYKKNLPTYGTPCVDMFFSVNYNWLKTNDDKLSNVTITYKQQYYEEIQYGENFSIESFVSNVGGFIGMFLGYSLMQLPDFLLGFVGTFAMIKKRMSTGFFGKCCGRSKKKNVIIDVPGEDFGATNQTNEISRTFYGCSSCGEVSKLGLRNSNRISELQHQNTTLTKELQVIKRLLENK